jgi:hypothetical protein
MLAQMRELAPARGFGVLHDLPVIVLPGSIFPIGTAGTQGNVLAASGQVLVAIEGETFPMPDIADGGGIDVAHAGIAGDVVTAHHHVATGIDVKPLEKR